MRMFCKAVTFKGIVYATQNYTGVYRPGIIYIHYIENKNPPSTLCTALF